MGNRYLWTRIPKHPLAVSEDGMIAVHRKEAHASWGDGPFECHWCHMAIAWKASEGFQKLVVDHLDGNSLNNDQSNLVPACHHCNISRMAEPLAAGQWYEMGKNGYKRRWGTTNCVQCGVGFNTMITSIGMPYVICCSADCRSKRKARTGDHYRGKKFPDRAKLGPGQIWVTKGSGRRRGSMRPCDHCGHAFPCYETKAKTRLCSKECRAAWLSKTKIGKRSYKYNPVELKPGELFIQDKNQRSRAELRKCVHCEVQFKCKKLSKQRFCSKACHYECARLSGYKKMRPRMAFMVEALIGAA